MTEQLLLLLEHRENRRLITDWLGAHYDVTVAANEAALEDTHDLVLLDGPALVRLNERVRRRKEREQPVFLPVVAITGHQEAKLARRHLWRTIDELIISPVEKISLQVRIETLLRARRLSVDLKVTSDDKEAFVHAMSHDLRAPMRAIAGFTEAILESRDAGDAEAELYYLNRVRSATEDMQELVEALLEFSRVGRGELHLQPVQPETVTESAVLALTDEIEQSGADITVSPGAPLLRADPFLLKLAFVNLMSNAIKYVSAGCSPRVSITWEQRELSCLVHIVDNGIGIAEMEQEKVFEPFARLHGVEDFPGVGLGLPTVRKAVELMGGRAGVNSEPGRGSDFWIELNLA